MVFFGTMDSYCSTFGAWFDFMVFEKGRGN